MAGNLLDLVESHAPCAPQPQDSQEGEPASAPTADLSLACPKRRRHFNLRHQGCELRDRILNGTRLLGSRHLLEKHEQGKPIQGHAKEIAQRPELEGGSANAGGIRPHVGDQQSDGAAGFLKCSI